MQFSPLDSAEGHLTLGMHAEALADLGHLSDEELFSPRALDVHARATFRQGRWEDMEASSTMLAKDFPERGDYQLLAGTALGMLGRSEEARECIRLGLELAPEMRPHVEAVPELAALI